MDRLAIRTNGTDWLLGVPNVGVEFDIFNKNYNRWAVNLNFRYRPGTNTKLVAPVRWEGSEIKVEGRMYWREREAQASGPLAYHLMPWDKLMSCRRMVPKHPNTVFYRGVYVSYGTYAIRALKWGDEGNFAQAGITWGFVKPLYAFRNGNSVDFEIGISGGIALAKNHEIRPDYKKNNYRERNQEGWKLVKMPVINDLHAALVYRLGKYPIQKKYRWRYDVDMEYRNNIDSTWTINDRNMTVMSYKDSIYQVVMADFRAIYDSVVMERRLQKQEMLNKTAPERDDSLKIRMKAERRAAEHSKKRSKILESEAMREAKELKDRARREQKEREASDARAERAAKEKEAEEARKEAKAAKEAEALEKEKKAAAAAALKAKEAELAAAKKARKADAEAAAKKAREELDAQEKAELEQLKADAAARKQKRADAAAAEKQRRADVAAAEKAKYDEEKKARQEALAAEKAEDEAKKKQKEAAAEAAAKAKKEAADAAKAKKAEEAAKAKEAEAAAKAKKAEEAAKAKEEAAKAKAAAATAKNEKKSDDKKDND